MFYQKLHQEKINDFYRNLDFDENNSFFNPMYISRYFIYIEKGNILRMEFDPTFIFKFDVKYEHHSLFELEYHCEKLSNALNEALNYKFIKTDVKIITTLEKKSTFPYFEIKRKYDRFGIEFEIQ